MYADDIKLFKAIEGPNDVFKLQNDINNLVTWSKHSGLSFNFKKCKCFTFPEKEILYITIITLTMNLWKE